MKYEEKQVKMIFITEVKGLDPITVILEDYQQGAGKIIIECYCEAWANYWGSMGDKTVGEFFCSCDNSYLFGKLGGSLLAPIYDEDQRDFRDNKSRYLKRIFDAVRDALEAHYALPTERP